MKSSLLAVVFSLSFISSTSSAEVSLLNGGLIAPNVNGTSNYGNPLIGEIIFDTSTAGFWGYSSSGWTPFGGNAFVPAYLSATSSTKTPGASGRYLSMTGNSVTLTPGSWKLSGSCDFNNSGLTPGYSILACVWTNANGADNGTVPTFPTADAGRLVSTYDLGTTSIVQITQGANDVRITTTSNLTIYLVPYVGASNPANARVTTSIYAEKVSD